MKTGFVGLGAMGAPMARNLHRAGLLQAVWNRTAERARALAEETGCRASTTLEALAGECDAIVLCVSADADVLQVVRRLAPALREAAVVMDCSTTAPETAREAAAELAQSRGHFLDCPVTGGTEGAASAALVILVGGEPAALARARPVLTALGSSISHMGPVGAGQAAKAVNQIMVAGINQAVSEALALARAEGLPMLELINVLAQGAAGSWFLEHRGPNMARDCFPLGFKVRLHQKDLEICQHMAQRFNVQLPIVEMTLLHYKRLLAAAADEEDISSLFRLKTDLFRKRKPEPPSD